MKAIICTRYGAPEVLKLMEVDKPVPKDHQVLIKIYATTAHIGDTKLRRLEPGMGAVQDFFFKPAMRLMLGFRAPRCKILGMDVAGEIVEVGSKVTKFKVGEQVFASAFEGFSFGGYAQYICLSQDGLISRKPDNISFEESAALANGAMTALLVLRKAKIQEGKKVLIYGASGSMGSYSVQLAKNDGAEVTGVCSTKNMEAVQSLEADKVLDYTAGDFESSLKEYDVIFDSVAKMPRKLRKKVLKKGGILLDGLSSTGGMKLRSEDLDHLGELAAAGKLKTLIDRSYPLEEMAEAHRYVDQGHKRGNVVITVSHDDD